MTTLRQIGLLAFGALCLVGCRPKGILHSWEMRDIIVDLHKTDALLQMKGFRSNDREAKAIYYAQVMEKHHTTQAEFDSSLVWYTAHPALFDKIYPKVIKELKAEEDAFLAQYPEFGMPQKQERREEPKPKPFLHSDLDSILWVQQNGLPNSWNEWRKPYNLRIDD